MDTEMLTCKYCVGQDCMFCRGLGFINFADFHMLAADLIQKRGLLIDAESKARQLELKLQAMNEYLNAGMPEMATLVGKEPA